MKRAPCRAGGSISAARRFQFSRSEPPAPEMELLIHEWDSFSQKPAADRLDQR
jgi:hypothetical protein